MTPLRQRETDLVPAQTQIEKLTISTKPIGFHSSRSPALYREYPFQSELIGDSAVTLAIQRMGKFELDG